MKQSEFITEHCSDAPSVAKAVIRQIGGWEDFKGSAKDIANHGIDGGFSGFIYHSDTTAFAKRNRAAIARLADELADSLGEDAVQMVKGFRCLNGDYSSAEIGRTLYGRGDDTQILNALAWFAGEEIARRYVDAV